MRHGLPFDVPTARRIARYVRNVAEDEPSTAVGMAYNPGRCVVAHLLPRHFNLTIGIHPYEYFFKGRMREPFISYIHQYANGEGGWTIEWGTIFMRYDLAKLARLFDTFPRNEAVRADEFLAAIQLHMPHLLDGR